VELSIERTGNGGGSITPAWIPAGAFTNGVWDGIVNLHTSGAQVRLAAQDEHYGWGESNPFDVVWFNDLTGLSR
jgi:hypothetical protein